MSPATLKPALSTIGFIAATFGYTGAQAAAHEWPTKPVRMVTGSATRAGVGDTLGRYVAEKLTQYIGQTFLIDNRPGAAGNVGAGIVGEDMMPGGMIFMRCNPNHHGIALVGGAVGPADQRELHHIAFEAGSLNDVFRARNHLREHGANIVFEGRRRAGAQVAIEFLDPDGHNLEIYWCIDQIGDDGIARPPHEWRDAKSLEEALTNPPRGQTPVLQDKSLANPSR